MILIFVAPIVHSGNTFQYYMIGLAGLFIGLGEIFGELLL